MKKAILFLCFSLGVFLLQAQDKTSLGVTYQYALPLGAFKSNFVNQGSARGINLDLMHTINPKWRVGAGVSYQDFNQKTPRDLYEMQDGSTLSAVVSNSVQPTTLMAKGMYLPTPESRLQPFVTAGIGVNMAQVNQMMGMFDNINDVNFGLAAQAGTGLKYGLGAAQRTQLTAGVLYNYLPFNRHGIGSLSNLTFGVGARFTLRQNNNRRDDDNWNGGNRRPRHYGW